MKSIGQRRVEKELRERYSPLREFRKRIELLAFIQFIMSLEQLIFLCFYFFG